MLQMERCQMTSFAVIGKEGSTNDGEGFIGRLWEEANSHFAEVAHLAHKDEKGNLCGIWGAMSDMSRSFEPWENEFTVGLYLAGVQCTIDKEAPEGWVKWVIPAYEYLYTVCDSQDTFAQGIRYLNDQKIPLAGAVHDFTCPQTGRNYLFFPVRRLD